MIRIAIVVCCAALAAAEADSDAFYGTYGPPGYHQGLYNAAFNTYNRYPAAVSRFSGYPAYPPEPTTFSGYAYNAHPAPTVGAYTPYGYAASGRYLADSVGAVHIAKREAEAEPEAEADSEADPAFFYRTYGHHGMYNTAFNNYRYPAAYSGYQSFYQPSYNNFGYRQSFYGKREAEAEPQFYRNFYNNAYTSSYNTYPMGYPTYPVSSYRNFVQPSSYYGGYGRQYYYSTTESPRVPASNPARLSTLISV